VSREGSKREREEKGRSTSDEIGLSDVALHRHQVMRLPHESYQCTWCDFLMSRVNRTDVTQMNHILKINFGLVHFLIFLKRVKIKKNLRATRTWRRVGRSRKEKAWWRDVSVLFACCEFGGGDAAIFPKAGRAQSGLLA
jgi:type IV secretory pathway TrbF-like protein